MNHQEQPGEDNSGNEESPVEKIVEDPKRDRESDKEEQPSNSLPKQLKKLGLDRKIELGIAVVGLIIASALAFIAVYQLKAMREQTDSMQGQLAEMKSGSADTKAIAESAKTQADNTSKLALATESFAKSTHSSVEQAKASLGATIGASHLGQRAWVAVKLATLCKDTGEPECPKPSIGDDRVFYAEIHNYGITPSLETIAVLCSRNEIPDSIRKDCPLISLSKAMLAPNMSLFVPGSDTRVQRMENTPQYVVGVITYKDIFGAGHWVTFCYMSPNTNTSNMSPCDRGNDMDKQPEN